MEAHHSSILLLIVLFPLIGAMINGFFGLRIQKTYGVRAVHGIAVAMPAIACLLSWYAFIQLIGLPQESRALYQVGWDWLHIGFVDARFAFWLDPLSSLMTLVITTVGTLIHVYSIGYMHGDKSYWRFFCYLNLFVTMMLILVLGDNFILMFIGWEGVGLASYLLIGFWYEDLHNAASGMKAFIVNRFGDFCFIVGMFALFWSLQGSWTSHSMKSFDWQAKAAEDAIGHNPQLAPQDEVIQVQKPVASLTFSRLRLIFEGEAEREQLRLERDTARASAGDAKAHDAETATLMANMDKKLGRTSIVDKTIFGIPILFWVCVLFFLGATAKSAQIPLYVWLPDAMAGPTPVSALIHAATMVTAGVYMIARLNFIYILSPGACTVVALVGALTALFAATMGLFQYDIKKVLAYSTVSQLGFMFIGVGTGCYWAGIFHLMTHACFKGCLFLCSGSVILGCHHEQDMRRYGGLKKYMPLTHWTYWAACIAIAGFPIGAGFYSKDEILWKAFTSSATQGFAGANILIWALGLIAATLTAFYMYRSYYMTFSGEYRGNDLELKDPYPEDSARAEKLFFPEASPGPSDETIAAVKAHPHPNADLDPKPEEEEHAHHGHGEPHESHWTMTYVLVALAFVSIFGGAIVGWPHMFGHLFPWHIESWLHQPLGVGMGMMEVYATHIPGQSWLADEHSYHFYEWALMFVSVAVALGGWFVARVLYKDNKNPMPATMLGTEGLAKKIHRLIYNKYFVDELYYTLMITYLSKFWNFLRNVDVYVVDGMVNLAGFIGRVFGYIQGSIDKYLVDGAVNLVATIVINAGQRIRYMQTGQLRTYLLGAFGGVVAAFMLLVMLM